MTDKQAIELTKAAKFGECQDVDGFMRFWQDQWLRTQIHKQAARWSKTKEEYQDLWAEAWTAICSAPPDIGIKSIWYTDAQGSNIKGLAYRAMEAYYRRELRYRKRTSRLSDTPR